MITNCPYCQLSTAGEHESNCSNRPSFQFNSDVQNGLLIDSLHTRLSACQKELAEAKQTIAEKDKEIERFKIAVNNALWHYKSAMGYQNDKGFPPGETAWAMNSDLSELDDLIKET